ncbi:hypothetical protein [Sunxiuqinia rutila]|uniref:hypothetical protein n=1 Tax=Sunxiuqinia rutila TaxID=1397841 RepID=UPI003D36DA9C
MNNQAWKENDYLELVRETQVDIVPLVDRARLDWAFRDLVVQQLVSHQHINVYFHSYRIMQQLTAADPVGCFRYWDDFVGLLQHANSYHRNYGMDLLADLLSADLHKRFDAVFPDYYKQLQDEKISTRKYCISYSERIIRHRPDLTNRIVGEMIASLRMNENNESHQNFLLAAFLELLVQSGLSPVTNPELHGFLQEVLDTKIPPKLRRELARLLV